MWPYTEEWLQSKSLPDIGNEFDPADGGEEEPQSVLFTVWVK